VNKGLLSYPNVLFRVKKPASPGSQQRTEQTAPQKTQPNIQKTTINITGSEFRSYIKAKKDVVQGDGIEISEAAATNAGGTEQTAPLKTQRMVQEATIINVKGPDFRADVKTKQGIDEGDEAEVSVDGVTNVREINIGGSIFEGKKVSTEGSVRQGMKMVIG
jgi:hypothetical protein